MYALSKKNSNQLKAILESNSIWYNSIQFNLILVGCNRFSVDGKEVYGYAPVLIDSGASSLQLADPIYNAIKAAMQVNCSSKYAKAKKRKMQRRK